MILIFLKIYLNISYAKTLKILIYLLIRYKIPIINSIKNKKRLLKSIYSICN